MRTSSFLTAIPFALLVAACSAQDNKVVDTRTLQVELAGKGVQLIDVRTPQEWSTGHIAGAQHIDWFRDDFKSEATKLDKAKPVRIYCAAGGRSEDARELLIEMGFIDVKDLDGGIQAWKKAGGAIER